MACDSPLSIKYKTPLIVNGQPIYRFPADCGKCLKCLTKRKAQWSYRITEEKRNSFSSYFVTLTYNNRNLPLGDNGATINKNDHFEFISKLKELEHPKTLKLRKSISKEENDRKYYGIKETGKLKYYGVYEYGDQFNRPHAHYILFNVRDIANIDLSWGRGNIEVDHDVNVNNIDYVLKYMVKYHSNGKYENKEKELSFMSKGIGSSTADKSFINQIRRIDSNQILNTRGSKIPIPRYYRKKYLTETEREKKNIYIAEEIQKQKLQQEASALLFNENMDLRDKNARDSRHQLLKSRSRRNLE